jgi:hypothetical protein
MREKYFPHQDSNSDLSAVQPIASCYTDCTVPAPKDFIIARKTNEGISLNFLHQLYFRFSPKVVYD